MPTFSYSGTGAFSVSGNYIVFEAMHITGTKSGSVSTFSGAGTILYSCIFENATSGSGGIALYASGSSILVENCDVKLTNGGNAGSYALGAAGAGAKFIGNRVKSSMHGIMVASASHLFSNQIINSAGVGITNNSSNVGFIVGNTIVGGSSDGIALAVTAGVQLIVNNCITDNSGFGINLNNSGATAMIGFNRTRDNGAGAISGATDWVSAAGWGAVTTDTGGPETDYTNASATDYRLISTSPAISVGIPSYRDMGALQHQATGGGSYIFVQ
jgi:hypothetical protein